MKKMLQPLLMKKQTIGDRIYDSDVNGKRTVSITLQKLFIIE